jgi:Flp pilus assembly protein TadD
LVPDHPEPHVGRADALTALGRHDEAREAYNRAIALNPDDQEVHRKRGLSFYRQGRIAEARATWRAMLERTQPGPPTEETILALVRQIEETLHDESPGGVPNRVPTDIL